MKWILRITGLMVLMASVHAQSGDVRVSELVDHKDLRVMAGVSNNHFHDAIRAYQKGDREAAVRSIRAGRVFVAIAVSHAKNDLDRSDLMTSFYELGIVADDIEAGKVKKTRALREVFSRTNYALARHYQSYATGSIREADRKLFKEAMEKHVGHSSAWIGDGNDFEGMSLEELDEALAKVSKEFGETRKADEIKKRIEEKKKSKKAEK